MTVVDDSAVIVASGGESGGYPQPAPSPYTWSPTPTREYEEVIVDTGTQPSAPSAPTPGAGPCNACGGAKPPPYQPGPSGPTPTPATTPAVAARLSGLPWWVWPLGFLAFAGTVNRG